jgi:porphobilinogen synthase
MSDVCLDEYTDHGHCGILTSTGEVDNDATLDRYTSVALTQASAGADVVAPSGMMDGQVGAIRAALDTSGFTETAILAYSAKYASALYSPFRDAAESALNLGDRCTYQQDPANAKEALREVHLDIAEGADMVMIKPAMLYLDIVRWICDRATVPVGVYQVSGEYAMVEAAALRGWLDRRRVIMESLVALRRSGAQILITYWATEAARELQQSAQMSGVRERVEDTSSDNITNGGPPKHLTGTRTPPARPDRVQKP